MASFFENQIESRNSNPKPLTKNDIGYGTPIPGSKTEARGKLAHQRVSREIWELCCIIEEHGITRKKKVPKKKKNVDAQGLTGALLKLQSLSTNKYPEPSNKSDENTSDN